VPAKRNGASKAMPPGRLRRPQAPPSPVQKLDRVFTQRPCSRIVAQRWRPQQGGRRPRCRRQPARTSLPGAFARAILLRPVDAGSQHHPVVTAGGEAFPSQHTTCRRRSFITLSLSPLPDDASAGKHTVAANAVAAAHLMVASPRAAAGRRKPPPATGTERKTPPRRRTSHRGAKRS
jgi:hypothetical protein